MTLHRIVPSLTLMIIFLIGELQASRINNVDPKQRSSFGVSLINPYFAYNPDYMGGNMPNLPNIPPNQNNINYGQPNTCTCTCGDMSFVSPIACYSPQTCASHCLQMYSGRCTLINTYGCCGSFCQYLQSQSLENRYCTCNCAGQQLFDSPETCTSPQACLTRCRMKYPQLCNTAAMQACCGRNCQSYSQSLTDVCICRCQGNTYFPSPKCANSEQCINTCMTTYGTCTIGETQGCCGLSCSSYIPTCRCRCGSNFTVTTSIPCQSGQSCLEKCIDSYGACNQDNTEACCGDNCANSYLSCSCMCAMNQNIPLQTACGSSEQCVQACLKSVAHCNIFNTRGCCGSHCSAYIPTCRCQCGPGIYYTTATACSVAETCTDACILQYGHVCTPTNTIGCCNETLCTRRNRFLGVSNVSICQISYVTFLLLIVSFIVV